MTLSEIERRLHEKEWADRFLPHQMELAREVIRVDVAPIEEDRRHNTDLILRSTTPLGKMGRDLRISARVRRHEYLRKMAHIPGLAYRNQITIRDRLPSGVRTEIDKVRLGDGDYFVYGFESEPGSDRLYPWVIVNLDLLREYDMLGGYSRVQRNKGVRDSWLRVFSLDDLPLGAILNSDGIELEDRSAAWLQCRNPNWDDKTKPVRSGWCSRGYVMATDDYMRKCLFCGFKWRTPQAI